MLFNFYHTSLLAYLLIAMRTLSIVPSIFVPGGESNYHLHYTKPPNLGQLCGDCQLQGKTHRSMQTWQPAHTHHIHSHTTSYIIYITRPYNCITLIVARFPVWCLSKIYSLNIGDQSKGCVIILLYINSKFSKKGSFLYKQLLLFIITYLGEVKKLNKLS